MPDRDLHLEKTTQTDLLYGVALPQQSDVAVLERAADASSRESFESTDPIVQQAATRDDLSYLQRDELAHDGTALQGRRWRYLDSWTPPVRPTQIAQALPEVIEPHVPWTMGRALRLLVRSSGAWAISFLLHLALLPALAVLGYPEPVPKPVVTYRGATAGPSQTFDIVDVPLSPAIPTHFDMHTARPLKLDLAVPEPRFERGAMPGLMSEASLVMDAVRSSGPVTEVIGLMADEGRVKAHSGKGRGGADFFGTKASGHKFVFVVDCSLSMLEDGRWVEAANALATAVDRLGPDQLFYVILFDGGVHRMFNHNEREAALFPATPENKQRFREWLMTARLGYETRPFLAMKCAVELQPDAVYLLSDGDFKDSTADFLKKFNRPYDSMGTKQHQVIVHTFSFHSRVGQSVMRRIARENAGQYLFVPAK